MKTEMELGVELVKVLDGVTIDKARMALEAAERLLLSSQVVFATSPLLMLPQSL
jgi:hypothetical protein